MESSVYHQHHHRLFLEKEAAAAAVPPYNHGERTSEYYASESTNFDSNMVIVLAALLCALICALGLNSIVRCALRFSYRFSSNTPSAVQAANLNPEQAIDRGIKKQSLSQIPEVKYESGLNIPVTDCPICLGEFAEGEKVRVLPKCNHGFHVKCIDKWILSHSSCPLCRQPLLEQSSTASCATTAEEQEAHIRVRIPGMPEFWTGR
ncbi:RING-H2 finger protein ATL74 [Ricinus communis]|uniref:RING-type E3 ubiquitin transferase n=1 Tax=Ricinus communis TaxID=3988 RepID=B9T0S4_RICCO|nr:RING-H2 finger protein ATL74 [Ricinus communis]EEF30541.1 ring finger protein, putative [Ricinus communis]|eukprot:XP_002531843.1 RING-H2 finger protein ATL74 [Ricinus communis]